MLKKLFLVTPRLALAVSGFIGISIFLVGDFDSPQLKMLGTTACIGGFSLTGLASVMGDGSARWWWRPLPYAGIISSAAALALIISLIWDLWDTSGFGEEIYFKLLASLVVIALSSLSSPSTPTRLSKRNPGDNVQYNVF